MKKTIIGTGIIVFGSVAAHYAFGVVYALIGGIHFTDGAEVHPDGRDYQILTVSLIAFVFLLIVRNLRSVKAN